MIELKHVTKFYNSSGVVSLGLRDVNLRLNKGEFVAIVGESGAGKSTLLNVISGNDSYDDGEMLVNNEETSYFDKNDYDSYRKNYVSFIHQNYQIIDSYTVLENVMLPMLIKGIDKITAKEKAISLIEKVGLIKRIKNRGTKLSGGEKQRLSIARALAIDAPIIACDEPTGNLDSITGKMIVDLIKEVSADKLVLFVTHNFDQVKDVATRVVKISDGEIVDDITLKEVEEDKEKGLVLDKSITPSKNLFIVLSESLKSTPKRTIFTFLIFMVLSAAVLFMLLSSTSWKDSINYTLNPNFNNSMRNRLVVYKKDRTNLDMEYLNTLSDKVIPNPFFEDTIVSFKYYDNPTNKDKFNYLYGTFSMYIPDDFLLIDGAIPNKENDCLIIFPSSRIDEFNIFFSSYIGGDIDPQDYRIDTIFSMSGFGISSEISEIMIVPYEDISIRLTTMCLNNTKITYVDENGETVNVKYTISPTDSETTLTLYGGLSTDIKEFFIDIKGLYSLRIDDFNLVKENKGSEEASIVISLNIDLTKDVYEASIYTNDIKKVTKDLEKNGYFVVRPSKYGVDESSDDYIKYLLFLGIMVLSCAVLTFIDYVIIYRISLSKLKDYSIIRSLGINNKSMKKMLFIEMFTVAIISSILSYGVVYFISIFNNYLKSIVSYNSIAITLIYLILNIIFSSFISLMISKGIFKRSVSDLLKGGNHD